jgi:predicted transcriptional regulator
MDGFMRCVNIYKASGLSYSTINKLNNIFISEGIMKKDVIISSNHEKKVFSLTDKGIKIKGILKLMMI